MIRGADVVDVIALLSLELLDGHCDSQRFGERAEASLPGRRNADRGVRLFARAQAFQPDFHVSGGHFVGTHVSGGGGGAGIFELEVGEQVGRQFYRSGLVFWTSRR